MFNLYICEICKKEYSKPKSFSSHLRKHKISLKDYYDKWLKTEDDGICKNEKCNKETKFSGRLKTGYYKYCSTTCCNKAEDSINGKKIKLNNHIVSQETREKIKKSRIGVKFSDITKQKLREKRKGKKPNLGKKFSNITKEKMSLSRTGEKNSFFGKKHNNETIEILRSKIKDKWNDPNSKLNSAEYKEKQSVLSKEKWKNEVFLEKIRKSICLKPNRPENFLINLFYEMNLSYEYTGDFSFWIGGKNPDFVDKNKKKIIEFFGSYFHSKEITGKEEKDHEDERIIHFKKYGYDCLVIWENKMDNIKEKILEFSKEKN